MAMDQEVSLERYSQGSATASGGVVIREVASPKGSQGSYRPLLEKDDTSTDGGFTVGESGRWHFDASQLPIRMPVDVNRPPVHPSQNPATSGHRHRELEWRRTHREELRQFAGQWVVLEGEEVVSHGKDPLQVVAEARARGVRVPYVFYVGEPTDVNPITMEW
jgi:hypothetical protein